MNYAHQFFLSAALQAQQTVSGLVRDQQGNPLPGANAFIKNSYDGATSDLEGRFSFSTAEQGAQLVVVSYISFVTQEIAVELNGKPLQLEVVLKEAINKLDGVTITAGAFGAGDEKTATSLKPLDILTTAVAVGDVAGALQNMPGTQAVEVAKKARYLSMASMCRIPITQVFSRCLPAAAFHPLCSKAFFLVPVAIRSSMDRPCLLC